MNTPSLLSVPGNASAYQHLIDHPRGSTRAWATGLGWTHSKMVRFLDLLKLRGLGHTVRDGKLSLFIPTVPKRSETFHESPPIPPSVLDKKQLPRYGERKKGTAKEPPTPEQIAAAQPYIEALNQIGKASFAGFVPVPLNNYGSVRAAAAMIQIAPGERGLEYFRATVRDFNAGKGGVPESVGHPFFLHGVRIRAAEYARNEAKEQLPLPLMAVERGTPAREPYRPTDAKPADPQTIGSVMSELRKTIGGSE